jgi:hypothetical protein
MVDEYEEIEKLILQSNNSETAVKSIPKSSNSSPEKQLDNTSVLSSASPKAQHKRTLGCVFKNCPICFPPKADAKAFNK